MQQQQQQQQHQWQRQYHLGRLPASASSSTYQQQPIVKKSQRVHRSGSSLSTTITSSTALSPNQSDHSSLPSAQIDPILERVSLTVTAVSLTPLSGNEVVRHIQTKTDDVITRFLPCVDFLVNCQQELRQGLQIAQASTQHRGRRHGAAGGRSRAGNGAMTSCQFHTAYVAPLPQRFQRQNESLMAREHLLQAASSLESLVRDAAAAMPQGCAHVKNAFLGGDEGERKLGIAKVAQQARGGGEHMQRRRGGDATR